MIEPDDPDTIAGRIADSVREQLDDGSSRRKFLNRSVLAGGALLVLGGGTGAAMAHESEDSQGTEMTAAFDDVEGTDLDVLNYALSLSNLENAFYREGFSSFSQADFESAAVLQEHSSSAESVYESVQTIGDHEAAHVDVLSEAVTLLGGDPSPEGSYDFGVDTVDDFLALAQVLENTGVAAYAGAAPFVESPDLQGAALSIHSVEARHAAFLNDVNGDSAFPNAFDPASSQAEVLDAVSQFVETSTETPTGNETATETSTEIHTETPTGNETG